MEEKVKDIQQQTGFDEDVIGCFLSNYKIPHVCPVGTGKWCKGYTACQNLAKGMISNGKTNQENTSQETESKQMAAHM